MAQKAIKDSTDGKWVVTDSPLYTVAYDPNAETNTNESIMVADESVIDPIVNSLNVTYGSERFFGSNPPGKPI